MARFSKREQNFILKELKKCRDNPVYFMKNYVKIRHPRRGIIKLNPFDYQRRLLEALNDDDVNIIFVVKSRQIGVTQLVASHMLYLTRFFTAKECLIVSQKMRKANEVQERVSFSLRELPAWMKPPIEKFSTTRYLLGNQSKCVAVPTGPDVGRSKSLNFLFIDEADMIDNVEEVWAASSPTLSTGGGKIVVVSTLKRYGWFWNNYKRFKELEEQGDESVRTFYLPYWVRPSFDEEWYKKQERSMGRVAAQRELKCDLSESEHMFYDEKDIKTACDIKKPKTFKRKIKTKDINAVEKEVILKDKDIWIWEKPRKNKNYFITCDTAKGGANSKNAIEVWDTQKFEQVAEYNGDIDVNELPWILKWFGERYNYAVIAVEENYTGYQVVSKLKDQGGYSNIVVRVKPKNIDMESEEKYVYMNLSQLKQRFGDVKYKIGWHTGKRTRQAMLEDSRTSLKEAVIHSERLRKELREFEQRGRKPKGVLTDDLVISYSIFTYLSDYFAYSRNRFNKNDEMLVNDMDILSDVNLSPDITKEEKEVQDMMDVLIG